MGTAVPMPLINHFGLGELAMSIRAVLYARVSGDDTKYATSGIDSQLDDCRKFALSRGYQIVGEYNEDANKHTSGADFLLPKLDMVLKLARQLAYDVLICREIDRLARNRFKQMAVENELERLGIQVEYVIGQYENTAEGRLLKGLMGEFAEFERAKIRERTVRGMVRAVEAGNITIGGSYAPYGYDLVTEDSKRQLVINDYEAAVIILIFTLYAVDGYTIQGLIDYLNEHNIPKPCKGKNHEAITLKERRLGWSDGTLSGILRSETYVGRWYYRKTRFGKNPDTGKRQSIPRPKDEWLMVRVPAIIDEELFGLAQRRRDENKRLAGKKRKNFYLLGGTLTCGHCGYSVTGMAHHTRFGLYKYYKCKVVDAPKRYGFRCDNVHFRAEEVDAAVWEWVKGILLSPERLMESFGAYQTQQTEAHQPMLDLISANEAKLAAVQTEKERIIKAYASGVLSLDEVARIKTTLDKQISDLTKAIAEFKVELAPKFLSPGTMETIGAWVAQIGQGVIAIENSPEEVREILKLLRTRAKLSWQDEKRWVDVTCILGEERLTPEYIAKSCNGGVNCL